MLLDLHARIKDVLRSTIRSQWNIEPPEITLSQTPKIELGELATPVSLALAKQLQRAPRGIAEELIARAGKIEGIERMEVAGAGYINFYVDRAATLRGSRVRGFATEAGKVIVEHTNINPNKAAHIGHLRNAAIGDTFVRILQAAGRNVEVQNYIDNTGVQVADVIVGLKHVEKKTIEDIQRIIKDSSVKFDYYCWDVYARVASFYELEDPKHTLRAETLKEIEEGKSETARMAELVAMTIARCHLRTMARINVDYDLLPRESDILHLKFWDYAFRELRQKDAIFFESEGKNKGCWVMRLESEGHDDDKIIVRSNGTVTYVGKDIAYQLWKLGLLKQDFRYDVFEAQQNVWVTTSSAGTPNHPSFGSGDTVYNVIDVRQSYLQNVVRQGLLGLGYEEQARRSIHFSYEVVALTPACAEELGIEISDEDRKRAHIEVSGRKGQGVKADDLLDTLENDAKQEVAKRNPELRNSEVAEIAHRIAVGALRYFLLKFTRNAIIAFDFREALNFDGETGPYLQYAAVRGNNIINKLREAEPDFDFSRVHQLLNDPKLEAFLNESNDIWELLYLALRLDEIANQVIMTLEPATLAKYAFTLAQRFSLFYHRYRIISEEDPQKRLFYVLVVDLVRESLTKALDLMGIEVPRRM
ncbi:MAG: arginine--tRNA ligase [Acidobacteria bacterium 13_1_20CM_2_57_8]|nr:MAG: arginine--tRNA ligase [Acidobacteria bacterium 13_1_20CM_2_57_8]